VATEAKVVRGKRSVVTDEATVVASDGGVISRCVSRGTAQVGREVTRRGDELVEDNRLGLNFTNLFSDNLLGHLLEDEETLLDNLDALGVADEFFMLLDNSLLGDSGDRAREVVRAVEVIESVERGNAVPVAEGLFVATGVQTLNLRVEGGSKDSAGQSSHQDKGSGDLGEHG